QPRTFSEQPRCRRYERLTGRRTTLQTAEQLLREDFDVAPCGQSGQIEPDAQLQEDPRHPARAFDAEPRLPHSSRSVQSDDPRSLEGAEEAEELVAPSDERMRRNRPATVERIIHLGSRRNVEGDRERELDLGGALGAIGGV